MNLTLRNGKTVEIRLLQQDDRESLFRYLQLLSPESRSRFGPHSFDWRTVFAIFDQPDASIRRYVAIDVTDNSIVSYMLVKKGMIEADRQRYAGRNQYCDPEFTVTFAPSAADA